MRVVLVGTPESRARLRGDLDPARIEVVAEFDALAEARAAGVRADAVMLAGGSRPRPGDGREEEPAPGEALTPREQEVLELLAEGLSNRAIAARLGISDQTVKFHVASIAGKLGASNRTDAVRRAVRRGLIAL
jgi:DNA-binding NarL/FixJ family response regulator